MKPLINAFQAVGQFGDNRADFIGEIGVCKGTGTEKQKRILPAIVGKMRFGVGGPGGT